MKGRKGSTDEGGVRSPLLVRWPTQIEPGRKISQISAAIDLLPTLADLASIQVTSHKPLDGLSLKPLLMSPSLAKVGLGEDSSHDRIIFSHWSHRVSARTQRYRLDHEGKLFDMVTGPGQYRDVSRQEPEVAARLQAAAETWKEEMLPQLVRDDRPFLIGHPYYRYTQIPARDGVAHGDIERSNRFPNCSFFTNWTDLDDKITWDAQVGATSWYEVEIYYTCPASDIGSTIELSFGDNRLTGRITEAHDPPLRGAENDRVERRESYVKDFKPWKLGRIRLEQGSGQLTLRATEIPGSQVMDFRLLMFTKADSL